MQGGGGGGGGLGGHFNHRLQNNWERELILVKLTDTK